MILSIIHSITEDNHPYYTSLYSAVSMPEEACSMSWTF